MKLTDGDIAQAAHDFTQDHSDDLRGIDHAWFEMMNKAAMRKILALDAQKREDADCGPPPAPLDRAIPPKLAGMNADECREPVKGEQWYDLGGKLSGPMADESDIATDDVMGRNRWIKTPPARMGYGRDNQIRSCLARDWSMIQIG